MLRNIHLKNFRNLTDLALDIPREGLIITGPNGSGKTSILEAVYTLATLKSFRAQQTMQCIQHGQNLAEVSAETENDSFIFRWQNSPKKQTVLSFNEIITQPAEILKKKSFFAVLFSPEDLFLPHSSPEKRRRYMNRVLIPLFSSHFQSMRRFEKILKTRNALLKRVAEGISKKDELDFYDNEFSRESEAITQVRSQYFEAISDAVARRYCEISGTKEKLTLRFCSHVSENVLETLQKNHERDIFRGVTTSGAHLDDFSFTLRDTPLQECGSRGEVRSAILALKISENEYLQSITGQKPLFLLDDVFSELDSRRRKHLAEMVSSMQTLITTTDIPSRAVRNVSMELYRLKKSI